MASTDKIGPQLEWPCEAGHRPNQPPTYLSDRSNGRRPRMMPHETPTILCKRKRHVTDYDHIICFVATPSVKLSGLQWPCNKLRSAPPRTDNVDLLVLCRFSPSLHQQPSGHSISHRADISDVQTDCATAMLQEFAQATFGSMTTIPVRTETRPPQGYRLHTQNGAIAYTNRSYAEKAVSRSKNM